MRILFLSNEIALKRIFLTTGIWMNQRPKIIAFLRQKTELWVKCHKDYWWQVLTVFKTLHQMKSSMYKDENQWRDQISLCKIPSVYVDCCSGLQNQVILEFVQLSTESKGQASQWREAVMGDCNHNFTPPPFSCWLTFFVRFNINTLSSNFCDLFYCIQRLTCYSADVLHPATCFVYKPDLH